MKKSRMLLLVVIVAAGLVLAGCGGPSPEVVVSEFTAALKAGDWEKAATYMENQDKSAFQKDIKDEKGEKFARQILSKAAFELGKAEVSGNQAKVGVKVTAVDMVRVAAKTMSELMPIAIAAAFSEDGDQKDMEAMAEQYFMNSISDPQAPMTVTDTAINLVKTGDGWKVSASNEEFFNAMTGNMEKAFAQQ
ncbi:MAG: hypothetical protein JL50_04290 [Peptococcaceae bacterium BICA1-7]|nr:MAG: hypothetical protein JL50_04290 [Peptococcaceae bacterium BICA1-7]HBV95844.1 DUF4878 domain-containing protein [Desulfotomaculum sp.]